MASPPSAHLRLDIQGLRAIAVIAVVLFHAGIILPGGFVGVDMFFVISGFVITLTLLRTKEKTGRISLKQFYLRRFRRLAPALAVVILFTLVASAFVLSPLGTQQNAALTALAAAVSVGNIAIALTTGDYFDAPAELNPFLHTWSLGVEEQFYIVFPIAIVAGLMVLKNRLSARSTVTLVVGIITAVSFLLTIGRELLPHPLDDSDLFGFYSPVTRAWEFGVGAFVALWSIRPQRQLTKTSANILYLAGFIAIGASFFAITADTLFPGWLTLLPVLGTAALIVAGHGSNPGNNLLSTKPMTLIGDWSYSIYLWHWPFVSLAKVLWEGNAFAAPLAALVSFVPAIVVFYLVEQRFRYRQFDSGRKIAIAIAGFVGLPAAIAIFFWLAPTALFGDQLAEASQRPIGYGLGCHVAPTVEDDPGVCVWLADESRPTASPLYLVGDSNAAHYADGLVLVAEEDNRSLSVMTARVCPFMLDEGSSASSALDPEGCAAWQEKVGDILFKSEPGVVIISTSDSYWLGEAGPLRLAGEELTPTAVDTINSFRVGLQHTTKALNAVGHRVIVVHTLPHWQNQYYWDLADCSLWEVLEGCNESMPTSFYLTKSQDIRLSVNHAAGDGVTVVDLLDVICPGGTCRTFADGYWVYRDDNHISSETSRRLAPVWQEALSANR